MRQLGRCGNNLEEFVYQILAAHVDRLIIGLPNHFPYVPWSKVAILGMVYWVDDHPLLYGNNGSLDPG